MSGIADQEICEYPSKNFSERATKRFQWNKQTKLKPLADQVKLAARDRRYRDLFSKKKYSCLKEEEDVKKENPLSGVTCFKESSTIAEDVDGEDKDEDNIEKDESTEDEVDERELEDQDEKKPLSGNADQPGQNICSDYKEKDESTKNENMTKKEVKEVEENPLSGDSHSLQTELTVHSYHKERDESTKEENIIAEEAGEAKASSTVNSYCGEKDYLTVEEESIEREKGAGEAKASSTVNSYYEENDYLTVEEDSIEGEEGEAKDEDDTVNSYFEEIDDSTEDGESNEGEEGEDEEKPLSGESHSEQSNSTVNYNHIHKEKDDSADEANEEVDETEAEVKPLSGESHSVQLGQTVESSCLKVEEDVKKGNPLSGGTCFNEINKFDPVKVRQSYTGMDRIQLLNILMKLDKQGKLKIDLLSKLEISVTKRYHKYEVYLVNRCSDTIWTETEATHNCRKAIMPRGNLRLDASEDDLDVVVINILAKGESGGEGSKRPRQRITYP